MTTYCSQSLINSIVFDEERFKTINESNYQDKLKKYFEYNNILIDRCINNYIDQFTLNTNCHTSLEVIIDEKNKILNNFNTVVDKQRLYFSKKFSEIIDIEMDIVVSYIENNDYSIIRCLPNYESLKDVFDIIPSFVNMSLSNLIEYLGNRYIYASQKDEIINRIKLLIQEFEEMVFNTIENTIPYTIFI